MAKCRPNDKDAKFKYYECNKIVKMRAFERAIAVDKPEKTLSEMYRDLENISKYLDALFDSSAKLIVF